MAETPIILVIGGPNGAGKSTLTPLMLKQFPHVVEFLNADSIARVLSGSTKNNAAYEAGRLLIKKMEKLAEEQISFGIESTLSGRTLAANLKRYKALDFQIQLVFVTLNAPEQSQARVHQRVILGGHDIPLADIQRRFSKSHRNFWTSYRPLADNWGVYDNSDASQPYLQLAFGNEDKSLTILDQPGWQKFENKVAGS